MKMHLITLMVPLLASIQTVHAIPLETPAPTSLSISTSLLKTSIPTISPNTLARRDTTSSASTTQMDSSPIQTLEATDSCTPTIAPDKNGYVPPTECNALYNYYPSFATAVAFSVLFGIILVTHIVQMFVYKTGFVWVIVMGIAWEFGGYLVRAFSTKHQQSEGMVTVSQILILLAPLWVNAFDYMILARMIWFFIPEKRIWFFKPSLLATIFVCLDFGSFVVQAIGGMMATPGAGASTIQTGLHIYMGGIGVQQFFICCFLVLAVQFHREMHHLERLGVLSGEKRRWKGLLYSLYFSLIAITVRIIYRLIEFTSGVGLNNPVTTHEWFMYAFDAFPMLLAGGVWCALYPGKILTGPDAKLPSSGLGRILCCGYCCCCCCRRGRKKKVAVSRGSERQELEELRLEEYHWVNRESYTSASSNWEPNKNMAYEPYRSQGL
ncbi:RTA1 domain protein [Talaromyces stipitatus ATCC 10500]|uniref:RTA1 domain protein n=1 Tax=Talaromyces stipitatus (strain ATCC 10500 / CBS 375.48 / QM 6759 / NRRL 1006) TaxID=441959 RepID=B8M153_TALSN|nr:RTA1 domain protein [Talaromyces stipitatus ATCC 10500]EED20995.1 RTA1 domain protein [Talaromyces stipitatus ATCC 10500]